MTEVLLILSLTGLSYCEKQTQGPRCDDDSVCEHGTQQQLKGLSDSLSSITLTSPIWMFALVTMLWWSHSVADRVGCGHVYHRAEG